MKLSDFLKMAARLETESEYDERTDGDSMSGDDALDALNELIQTARSVTPDPPAIRFIVETVSSETDRNGNRYHWARITSTITGRSIRFHSNGQGNALHLLRRVIGLYTFPTVSGIEMTLPKRQWQRTCNGIVLYEHQVTAQMITDLEVTS